MERDKDHNSGSMPGSHPSIRGNPPEILGIEYHGISKGKEQFNDIGPTFESKVQIWQ
jgi:hypothetical protein